MKSKIQTNDIIAKKFLLFFINELKLNNIFIKIFISKKYRLYAFYI